MENVGKLPIRVMTRAEIRRETAMAKKKMAEQSKKAKEETWEEWDKLEEERKYSTIKEFMDEHKKTLSIIGYVASFIAGVILVVSIVRSTKK